MDKEPKKGYKRYCLSLTGDNSHIIDLYIGQSGLSIGTKGISEGQYDVWVKPGEKINWDAFNEFYTEYGSRRKDEYPYGDWPRGFVYSGMDTGFIEWTSKRRTENFTWIPTEDAQVNLENVMIDYFFLELRKKVQITIGPGIRRLYLQGDPKNLKLKVKGGEHILSFKMTGYCDPEKIYRIPEFSDLSNTESVYVEVSPIGDPFDCGSLLQFEKLKHLQIIGNICNAKSLSELKELESLRLFSVPDLSELPPVDCWKHLDHFLGVDIDEIAGKEIRKQLKALEKEREIEIHISKLRSKEWFATEYDNPFKGWEGKNGKKASRLYKDTLKEIKKVTGEEELREHIICFTKVFNTFDNIDTVEREDIWMAVNRLSASSSLDIAGDTLMQWFDEVRDY